MFRYSILLVLGLVCFSCNNSTKSDLNSTDDEKWIHEARALSNQAIANHDTLHIGDSWMDNFFLLTSTNQQVVGKEENIKSFTDHFKGRPDVVYVRTPDQVQVFDAWGMASEYGKWEGHWTDNETKIDIGGTYYAKWHKVNGKWLIRAEIFTPTHCTGGEYCAGLKM